MLTGFVALSIQVWDVAEGNPVCVHTHDSIDAGAIFCAAFAPDEPFYIAAGGAKGKVNHHHHMCRHESHSANLMIINFQID